MKCIKCNQEIKEGDQLYQLNFGIYRKQDMGGYGFEEAKSTNVHGYIHYGCYKNV